MIRILIQDVDLEEREKDAEWRSYSLSIEPGTLLALELFWISNTIRTTISSNRPHQVLEKDSLDSKDSFSFGQTRTIDNLANSACTPSFT